MICISSGIQQSDSDIYMGFPVTQLVKNPPAMWETWSQSLGWEDPLEKGKATHSSILAWRIPWAEYIYIYIYPFSCSFPLQVITRY